MTMRSPSLAPDLPSGTIHMVLDDFGKLGRSWRELDENETDERDIVDAIASGQFNKPIRVVAFNVGEGWCNDVTEDIARAVVGHLQRDGAEITAAARQFYERATGQDVPA